MAIVRGNPVAWQSFYKTARWQRLREFQLNSSAQVRCSMWL
jgi:hypothetical protein